MKWPFLESHRCLCIRNRASESRFIEGMRRVHHNTLSRQLLLLRVYVFPLSKLVLVSSIGVLEVCISVLFPAYIFSPEPSLVTELSSVGCWWWYCR